MTEPRAIEDLSYEEAFEELEAIVASLEAEELELEESLSRFERGQKLAGYCTELLESAELKLNELAPHESGGPLEGDESEEGG